MTAASDGVQTGKQIGALERFKALLLEISVRFVHLAPDQVDGEIDDGLRRVCEALDVQRSSLWQCPPEAPDQWQLTHLYQHPNHAEVVINPDGDIVPRGGWTLLQPKTPPRRMAMDARDFFPWSCERLHRHEAVVIDSLEDLPPEAARDRKSFEQFGSCSILVFPLEAGDRVIGVLSFAMIAEERIWGRDIVNDLQLISQCFAHAVARKIDDMALRQSEERLSLAASAAEIALWSIENGSERVWISESGRERFELPLGELTLTRFLSFVHPEDRATVEAAYRSCADGAGVEVEYRLVGPDASVRWVCARARQQFDSAGRPMLVMGVTLDITERKEMERRLKEQLYEISRLKTQLEAEVVALRDQVKASGGAGEILGMSDAIQYIHFRIGQVAPLDATVLILGDTGTGKNLAAAAIHAQSRRKDRPLITVSCAALPATLIESELFGRDRGAFTGADQARAGRFEIADGATIFLDEIGDLPLELQAKLLRVVQTGEFERLGSSRTLKVDVRMIAATNWDLSEAVREGRFRADLFYRLNVFPITMPPLRARKADIAPLTEVLAGKYASKYHKSISAVSRRMLKSLQEYDWPGNVRELENVVERAVILSTGPTLHLTEPLSDCTQAIEPESRPEDSGSTLEELERKHIRGILRAVGWRIEGKGGAAKLLGLNPSTLRARMRKLGIRRRPNSSS